MTKREPETIRDFDTNCLKFYFCDNFPSSMLLIVKIGWLERSHRDLCNKPSSAKIEADSERILSLNLKTGNNIEVDRYNQNGI